MTYILFIWTAIAATNNFGGTVYYDWRPMGEFAETQTSSGLDKCHLAAQQLGLGTDRYRCVRNK